MNSQIDSRHSCTRIAGLIILAAVTLAGAGCTRPARFPVEFNTECVAGDPLAGEWVGELTNASGSDSRRIRATYRAAGENTYVAAYRTTIGLGLPLQYDTIHHVMQDGGVLRIEDWREADIPGLGACGCRAVCNGTQVVIHYRTADDSGIIRLQRTDPADSGPLPIHELVDCVADEWANAIRFAAR
jgi:hypothetical protein